MLILGNIMIIYFVIYITSHKNTIWFLNYNNNNSNINSNINNNTNTSVNANINTNINTKVNTKVNTNNKSINNNNKINEEDKIGKLYEAMKRRFINITIIIILISFNIY